VTLITRYGASKVSICHFVVGIERLGSETVHQIEEHLRGHIEAVQKSGHPVIWVCDPMHGK